MEQADNNTVTEQGFPWTVYTWGGGQVQGDKALMEGLMRGDIDLMGGLATLIDYIINKSTVIVKLQLHNAIYSLRFY